MPELWGYKVQTSPYSDYVFEKLAKNLTTGHSDPHGHLFDQYERYAYPGNYTDPGESNQYAIIRLKAPYAGHPPARTGQGDFIARH